ncbi:MAG: S8 family serine peptidase [Saprospiraceae bacterium]
MKQLAKVILAFALIHTSLQLLAQTSQPLLNEMWSTSFGQPFSYEWASSKLDANDNFITVSHTKNINDKAVLLLTKQDIIGQVVWEQTFSLNPDNHTYGIKCEVDANNNIYAIGTGNSSLDGQGNLDFILLKYDQNGSLLWQKSINGTANGDDIPSGIVLTSNNKVFVTGLSRGISNTLDYLTVCLSGINGNTIWTTTYNYNNLEDVPIGIKAGLMGNIVVTGGSGASITNWEIATLSYDAATGAQQFENRLSNNGFGISIPSAIETIPNGDIFVTGSAAVNSTDFNVRTVKIKGSDFTTNWEKTFEITGTRDSSVTLKTDHLGNILVCGWSENQQGGKSLIILKYNAQGTLLWQKIRTPHPIKQKIVPRQLLIKPSGDFVVVSNISHDNQNTTLFSGYDANGELLWERKRSLCGSPNEVIVDAHQKGHTDIWLTCISGLGEKKQICTGKFKTYERDISIVYDDQGLPTHVGNELIIRFNSNIVDTNFVNNTELEFGKISDIINDPSVISTIDQYIAANQTFQGWDLIKIYKTHTTADSTMTTADGRVIRLPPYWASFILKVPRDYQSKLEELVIKLNDRDLACFIVFAELNPVGLTDNQCDPNDPLYSQQASLHPTAQLPNGHINCEEAWCETTGSSSVKMAIFDTGIRWSHEDFGDGSFAGSVVDGGKDFFSGVDVNANSVHTTNAHGTNVTGIVGAIRNNSIGIAGISGGDNGSSGTRFVNIKAFGDNGIFFGDIVCSAYDAMIQDEFTANIINISASYPTGDNGDSDPVRTQQEIREKLRLISQKGIIHVGSAGNASTGQPNYPAAAQDEWTINVSGSNQSGQVQGNNFGPTVDLIAPSATVLVQTTDLASDQAYNNFNGTSSSAPHVAGVAALLLAYDNGASNLTPDDIESILQFSAKDVILPPAGTGYDDYSGWGMLNAGAAINLIKKPDCGVYHFGTDVNGCIRTEQQIATDLPIFLRETFTNSAGITFNDGNYIADVYRITADCSHALPSPFTITRSWERHSTSSAFGLYKYEPNFYQMDALVPVEHVELVPPVTNNQATIVGYVYYLKNNPCTVEGWIPVPPQDAQLTYSVLGCMTSAVNEPQKTGLIQIFPNPVQDLLTVEFNFPVLSDNRLSIYAVSGILLSEQVVSNNMSTFQMDVSELPPGFFWLRCQSEKGDQTVKFIKI